MFVQFAVWTTFDFLVRRAYLQKNCVKDSLNLVWHNAKALQAAS